ncbi:MAG TPA: FkbM family methyltransferase [Thermoanaerobaculia bacterium]|jgi:FkbM family methyltransferase|nr:FkbM family methyltransferase [Thermoanaerobaculia bacterium]
MEALFDVRVYSTHPHGRDDCHDIQGTGAVMATILDVGANDGVSAIKFRDAFPAATIHAFEPVTETFAILKRNVEKHKGIYSHQMALGAAPGTAQIYLTEHSTMCSLVRPDAPLGEETVRVTTIDDFAAEHHIDRIDLLKVDAEGFDLEVLHGAERLLDEGNIGFVLAEVGFHRGDNRHVLFDDIRDFLISKGFGVFGFYDQQPEWSGENRLRYSNACFFHESVAPRR